MKKNSGNQPQVNHRNFSLFLSLQKRNGWSKFYKILLKILSKVPGDHNNLEQTSAIGNAPTTTHVGRGGQGQFTRRRGYRDWFPEAGTRLRNREKILWLTGGRFPYFFDFHKFVLEMVVLVHPQSGLLWPASLSGFLFCFLNVTFEEKHDF